MNRCSLRPRVPHLTLLTCFLVLSGCGGSGSPYPVESSKARETLQAVLQSWQDGDSPESWAEKSPEVIVQDMDWKTGSKLNSFEIIGTGEAVDANLVCDVKLNLVTPEGEAVDRTVTYLIGTDPVLTVFRKVEF